MAAPETPERAVGLLEQIADTALDDDYYVVRAGTAGPSREFNTLLTGLVLAVFALLVAIAAIQTRSDRPATERERATLISDIDSRKDLLAGREVSADRLRRQVADLQAAVVGVDPAFEELRLLAADAPASGPGIRVTAVPSASPGGTITDRDLQILVNALWYAGAEAISLNGQRIGTLTAIHSADSIVKVNYVAIGAPFELEVIGDPDSLEDRFDDTPTGQLWEQRRRSAGIRFDVTGSDDLSVGAAPKDRRTIRRATAIEGDS